MCNPMTISQVFKQADEATESEPHIGDRVRYKRPGTNTWREGTVKRHSYDARTGTDLLQVTVDTVGGGDLYPTSTARIASSKVELISRRNHEN